MNMETLKKALPFIIGIVVGTVLLDVIRKSKVYQDNVSNNYERDSLID